MFQNLNDELLQASVQVLEELCFVCPDPAPAKTEAEESATRVTIDFRGPSPGRFELRLLEVPIGELAAAMLGEEDGELTDAEKRDAVGEVANVICGNLLPRLAGTDAVYDLGPPTFGAPPRAEDPDGIIALSAMGGRIEVSVHLDESQKRLAS
jgi:CheY-specific phosphatase CheX